MICDSCKKDSTWFINLGKEFICYKCINKHKEFGLILRTSADSFKYTVKKLNIDSYDKLMKTTPEEIKKFVNVKKYK